MSKQTYRKLPVKTRCALPELSKEGGLMCPFCKPSHSLDPFKESPCGTTIRVEAVQIIYKAAYMKESITCLKCGGDKGEMVRFQGAFIHAHDCKPGMALMPETPKLSRFAKFVYNLPEKLKKKIEKRTGHASPLELIDETGNKTGEVAGYFFYQGGQHAT